MIIYKTEFGSSFEIVDLIVKDVISNLKEYDELNISSLLFRISFMLRELLNNGVEHGNKFDKEKSIFCEIFYDAKIIEFIISDEGDGISLPPKDIYFDVLSERERGISTILKLGFELTFEGSTVRALYNLKDFKEGWLLWNGISKMM